MSSYMMAYFHRTKVNIVSHKQKKIQKKCYVRIYSVIYSYTRTLIFLVLQTRHPVRTFRCGLRDAPCMIV